MNGESGLLTYTVCPLHIQVRVLIWREIDFLFTREKRIFQIGILKDV
jgi:hypothetical protein